jgi:rsbT co-antagonist protein RsbR
MSVDRTQEAAMQDRHDVMQEMGLTEESLAQRQRLVGLEAADLARIAALRDLVTRHADGLTDAFFAHLSQFDEASLLMGSRELEQARRLQHAHLIAITGGHYTLAYAEQQIELGILFYRVKLAPTAFLGAFHHVLRQLGDTIVRQWPSGPLDGFDHFMSLKKVVFFDLGLVIDAMVFERERVVRQQAEAINELSTPVLQIRDRLLLLPLIGVIDTHRARLLTESLLRAIRANRAKVAVMDVTGVVTIDSKVANHLQQTVAAARLMGTHVIVTGVSSEVAQSLVALGIDLEMIDTSGDLQGGMEEAEHLLGYRLVRDAAPVAGAS